MTDNKEPESTISQSEKLIGGALGALMISDAAFIKPVKERLREIITAAVAKKVDNYDDDKVERVLSRVTQDMLDTAKSVVLEDVVDVDSDGMDQVFYSLFVDKPVARISMRVTGFKDEAELNERIIWRFVKAIMLQHTSTFNDIVDAAIKALKRGQL